MNLIEAAKTGRPFRRPTDTNVYGKGWYLDLRQPFQKTVALDLEDILATDWELQPLNSEEESGSEEMQRAQG